MWAQVNAGESTGSTTYVNLTTTGPSLTTPLAGDYDVTVGALHFGVNAGSSYMSFCTTTACTGGGAPSDTDAAFGLNPATTTGSGGNFTKTSRKTALSASAALTTKYRTTTGNAAFGPRWMQIIPLRVQ
jgi:hypothetical protein